jgi:hypothetical protein
VRRYSELHHEAARGKESNKSKDGGNDQAVNGKRSRCNGTSREKKDTMTDNHYTPSNKIGIRVSDYKPGVMYQTQAAGIEFAPSYRSLDTYCPKCGAHNTPVYFPGLLRQRHVSGTSVLCHECNIPYPVEIKDEEK